MIEELFNRFKWFQAFKEHIRQRAIVEGRDKERDSLRLRDESRRHASLAYYVGRPVIVVPNEWCNPVIGFGKEVQLLTKAQSPILVVEDALSGEDRLCMGVQIDFSMQKLDAALTLDPYQLWAITAHNAVGNEDFDKPKSGERWPKEQIMAKLHQSGFFQRWEKYRSISGDES